MNLDTQLIAQRSIERAKAQHVRAFRVGPGQYRSHSRSDKHAWYNVRAIKIAGRVVVECDCKGGQYLKDAAQLNSLCKHAIGTAKRLLRRRDELAEVMA